ncbi:MAG TPA: HEAT repeat domain-containing protein [Vicinamibacterales bacterium]|nr:HEAT repeat domain-containing protein [Vicinamibacterales bacterium]
MKAPGSTAGSDPVSIGVFSVDTRLQIAAWDDWMAEASGMPAASVRGRELAEVIPSLAERGLLDEFRLVLSVGAIRVLAPALHHYLIPCPPRVPSSHFDRMQQRVTLAPLRDGTVIVGVMVAVEDVTPRLDAERTLAAALQSGDERTREEAAQAISRASHVDSPELFSAALRDPNWRVRRDIVQALARHATRPMMVSLLNALRAEHRDFNVLSSALQLLAACDVDVVDCLIELLQDSDVDLRVQAALALGEQQRPDAVEALIRALADEDVNVRFHAIEALGRLRAREAVDALVALAGGDFFVAFPAIDALAQINDPRAGPALVPLLSAPELSDSVAEALGELGDVRVVAPLVEGLNADRPLAPIVRALARLHARIEQRSLAGELVVDAFRKTIRPAGAQRLVDALAGAGVEDLRSYVLVLGWLQGAAVQRALTRLLGNPDLRAGAIEAIARQGAPVVDLLIQQLDADDVETRIAAVKAIARIGSPRAAPALIPLLGGDDRQLVAAAAAALGALGDPAAFTPLLTVLRHSDATVRQAAIGALNSLGHAGMPQQIARLLTDPDPLARESAARIAGYFGYSECMDPLVACCNDSDERVRRAALEQLPYIDERRALPILRRALTQDTPRARAGAAHALGMLGGDEAARLLLDATDDPDAWVRYFALNSLGTLRVAAAVQRIVTLSSTDPGMHVRIAALDALGKIGGTAAADVLLRHAAHDDSDLAAAALRALGGSSDPRAERALSEAARSGDRARRLAAVDALATKPASGRIPLLAWISAADEDDRVRASAIEALAAAARAETTSTIAISELVTLAADGRCRDGALKALSQLPPDRISALEAAFDASGAAARCVLIPAFCRMQQPDASAVIRKALDDPDPSVREAAIRALDELGARGVARRFSLMARQDPSRSVRRAAAAAFARQSDTASADESL